MAKKDELNKNETNALRAAVVENDRDEIKEAQAEGEVLNPAVDESLDRRPVEVKNLSEEELDQGETEVAPEEGLEGQPVFTPGVYAPISSVLLPNAQRDAELLLAERIEGTEEGEVRDAEGIRADETATGARDARDLAKLLEAHPEWINNLDQLEELEKDSGVKNPAPWVKNPVDLLEEAKRHNIYFIGANGNFLR